VSTASSAIQHQLNGLQSQQQQNTTNLLGQLFVRPPNGLVSANLSPQNGQQNSPNTPQQISPNGGGPIWRVGGGPQPTSTNPIPSIPAQIQHHQHSPQHQHPPPLVAHRRVGRPPKHLHQPQIVGGGGGGIGMTMPSNGGNGNNVGIKNGGQNTQHTQQPTNAQQIVNAQNIYI